MPETDQLLPSTNGYYDIPKNADSSIDIWFGPKKPDGVADSAFIKAVAVIPAESLPGAANRPKPSLPGRLAKSPIHYH